MQSYSLFPQRASHASLLFNTGVDPKSLARSRRDAYIRGERIFGISAQWLVTYIRFARSLLSIFGHLGIYKNGSRVDIGSADYCNHFIRTSVCPCVPVAALLRSRA